MDDEDEYDDLRRAFMDADVDNSGFLSIDEFYTAILYMGVDITREQTIKMFSEFDVSGDNKLSIDEFAAILNQGKSVAFGEKENKEAFIKVKAARQLDELDFLKIFKTVPKTYTQSLFT